MSTESLDAESLHEESTKIDSTVFTDAPEAATHATGVSSEHDDDGGDDVVGDTAADYIEELLDICDLDGDIEIDRQHGRSYITVTAGEGANIAVLSASETVTALQDLTRLAVQAKTGVPARLILDIGGSRDQRTRELGEIVDRAAAAIESGRDAVSLEAMSSYERKLVHDLVAEHGLSSHSEGEGSARHTVITAA